MKKNKLKSVLGAFVTIVAALSMVSVATAPVALADGEDTDKQRYQVQVSPPTQKFTLEPGTTYEGSFKVYNAGTESFDYKVESIPFSVTGKDYNPNYTSESSRTQISKWITIEKDNGHLDPGSDSEVHFVISVPNDAPGGGQYAALATSVKNGDSGNLETVTRVAMLVYANILGDTREEGAILENNVPSIVFGGNPITATSLVENTGNAHGDVKYTLKVYPFGSDEELFTNEENPVELVVMPDTQRYNSVPWTDTPQLGLYTVEQTIEFLGQTSTTSKLVLVCPVWLIVIFIALILAIVFTVVSRARARQQDKRESSASRSVGSKSDHKDKEED